MSERITSSDIHVAMSARWAAPEWAIMWEVGEATGANRGRYADAVMMSLWPSRGLELHGVEIKVSKSDWKREAADPRKAEAVAKFCDRWWIHTTPNVVTDTSELPPAWGLREWNGKGWGTIREAEKTDAAPITRPFLAAMLRRADGSMRAMIDDAIRKASEKEVGQENDRRKRWAAEVEAAAARRTSEISSKAEKLAAFEASFGDDVFRGWGVDFAALGHAARLIAETNSSWGNLDALKNRLRNAADAVESAQALFAAPLKAERSCPTVQNRTHTVHQRRMK